VKERQNAFEVVKQAMVSGEPEAQVHVELSTRHREIPTTPVVLDGDVPRQVDPFVRRMDVTGQAGLKQILFHFRAVRSDA
jgi:hypothetical protein